MSTNGPEELASWKEIAERLQVTVRTAQDWEKKRGLPVRRVPGGRGRVYLRVSELDAWLDGQLKSDGDDGARYPDVDRRTGIDRRDGQDDAGGTAGHRSPNGGLRARAAIGALVVAALALALWWLWPAGKPPIDWDIVGDQLIVRDEDGVEVWRVSFEDGLNGDLYGIAERHPLFIDLDDDGEIETLFIAIPAGRTLSHTLFCFSQDGEELWRFQPGRAVHTATDSFENIYNIGALRVGDLEPGRRGIVVASAHYIDHPAQIVVLSTEGEVISEYWHSGHIGTTLNRLFLFDGNRDGRTEIYAGGVNNDYELAALVVLDPFEMGGASVEEDPEYQLSGFAPDRHIARVLFPRSALNRVVLDHYNAVVTVGVTGDGITIATSESLKVANPPTVIRRLNFDFTLDEIYPSDLFAAQHESLYAEGKVERSFDEEKVALMELEYVGPVRSLVPAR